MRQGWPAKRERALAGVFAESLACQQTLSRSTLRGPCADRASPGGTAVPRRKRQPMRQKTVFVCGLAVLAVLAVLLAGCGSTAPLLNPAQAQSASTVSEQEGHTGQLLFAGRQEPALLDFEFVRQGQGLAGVGRVIIPGDLDGVDIAVGRLNGTDNGRTHSFSIDFGAPYGRVSFQGTSNANGFSGSHDGGLPPALGVNAQGAEGGTYQSQTTPVTSDTAPLAGRYTVTLDDGTTMSLNITEPVSPDSNLPDVTGLSQAIVAWVGDPGAMQPMDAGGGSYLSGRFNLRVNPFDSQRYPFFSCVLFGTAASGKYIQFRGQDANIKQGTYAMKAGFNQNQ